MNNARAAALAVFTSLATVATAQAQTLHHAGPPEDRVDLVLLAEGYEDDERDEFREDAQRVLATLRATEPFDRYLGLMNIHAGFFPSADGGIGSSADNRYGTRYYGARRVQSTRMTQVVTDAQQVAPEVDYILIICNDWRHGGTASGKFAWATTSLQFTDAVVHELGHILANLADEYEESNKASSLTAQLQPGAAGYDARYRDFLVRLTAGRANVTPFTDRARIPWRAWIEPGTRIPARFWTSGVSAWEGSMYFSDDLYRPRRSCRMRSNRGSFCEPCREALVVALHEQTRPSRLEVQAHGSEWVLRIESGLPRADLAVAWDGVAGSGLEVRLPRHVDPTRVRVRVQDGTAWARLADRGPLTQTLTAQGGGVVPPSSASGYPVLGTVTTAGARLRVRSGPGTSHAVVGHLDPNAQVLVTGPAQGGWYPVRLGSTPGFASARYIDAGSSVGPGLVGALAR